MSISVIIPAYNARKYLPECLDSIGRQSLLPKEILIIDDASPEPVDDIVDNFANRAGYPPIRLIRHDTNRGQAAGRNTGMKESSSEWLAFLDSDDMWAPNHLESVMCAIHESGADLGFCPATLFHDDPHDKANYVLRPLTADEVRMRPLAFLNRCFIITSSTVIRAATLRKISGFDESPDMRGVEDLECFMRLLREGAEFCMAGHSTLYYRKHPESATGRVGYLSRQDIRAKLRHISWPEGTAREKRLIMLNSYWRAAAKLYIGHQPERFRWLGIALLHSFACPVIGVRWMWRYLRAIRHNSDRGL